MTEYTDIQTARIAGALTYTFRGEEIEIDKAAHCVWAEMSQDDRYASAEQCGEEPIQHHDVWLKSFYAGRWASAVLSGELTRAAYVRTLSNLHYYVRDTTRLLGCAVMSAEPKLRAHFAKHLAGEVNHELLIERDLVATGVDAGWYAGERQPSPSTKLFALIQQGTIAGLDPDPVSFLACPLAAEGVSAHMLTGHIEGLHRSIKAWGGDPATSARFLTSHIHTDGAEGGAHHLGVVTQVRRVVRDEPTVRRFLATQRAAQDSFLAAFDEACSP